MINNNILITGISGFLGSQIAKHLTKLGLKIIATKRKNSNLWRCSEFIDDIVWIDTDEFDWPQKIISLKPYIIVHSAWSGVSSLDRDNWELQLSNIDFAIRLLQIAKSCDVKKFIAFGSQAEYGNFSGIIDENYPLSPNSAYASSKIAVSQLIYNFCTINNLNWYWFRLFSFFGELEDSNWFIPTLIDCVLKEQKMNMTPGEQKYAYMYVEDLASIIGKVITKDNMQSGFYNISSSRAISLIDLVNKIIGIIKPVKSYINFGAIAYRDNQPMHLQGKTLKLEQAIGENLLEMDFDVALTKVVNHKINTK